MLVLLVVVACDAPRPTPATEPASPTDGPTIAAPSSPPPASPEATAAPREPSALDRINDASANGELSEGTSYLYRYFALWGDSRLPEAYRGRRAQDHTLGLAALERLDALPESERAALLPFVVRPTDATSYFSAAASAPTAARAGPVLARALADDPRCNGGQWARVDLPTKPVTIWAHCALQGGSRQLLLADALAKTELAVERLWDDMTALMNRPIPDEYGGPFGIREPAEADDGRFDIYLVDAPKLAYDRNLDVSYSGAASFPDYPHVGLTWSSYVVLDPVTNAHRLVSTIAHEIFHSMQSRYNATGTQVCPYPDVTTNCPVKDQTHHWFVEASAVWAEHEFVAEFRPQSAHIHFSRFLQSPLSLMDSTDENQYDSFMWPLFMEQESPVGSVAIADTWKALAGAADWTSVQKVIDKQLPFETEFREFAVRVWNEAMPGDPISPRFRSQKIDPIFPEWSPRDAPGTPRFKDVLKLNTDVIDRSTLDMPELWAAYYEVTPSADAGRLTLNFAGLAPHEMLDVDALVKVGSTWGRRELDSTVTELCLDTPAGRIDDVILILSNHSQKPKEHVKGDWTALAEAAGCGSAGDAIVYTFTAVSGAPGADVYGTESVTLTLHLKLKANDGTTGYLADFLNDGSTFTASITRSVTYKGIEGCDTTYETVGSAGGPVPTVDGVVASIVNGDMTVAAGVTVPVTVTTSSCLGSGSDPREEQLVLPSCTGLEIVDNDPGSIFNFVCSETTAEVNWSLTGKVRVDY